MKAHHDGEQPGTTEALLKRHRAGDSINTTERAPPAPLGPWVRVSEPAIRARAGGRAERALVKGRSLCCPHGGLWSAATSLTLDRGAWSNLSGGELAQIRL